jgi:hypothetical protein
MRWSRIAVAAASFAAAATIAIPRASSAPARSVSTRAAPVHVPTACLVELLHPGNAAIALMKVDAAGRVDLTLRFDILACALDEDPGPLPDSDRMALLAGSDESLAGLLDDARGRFAAIFELDADGKRMPCELLAFPSLVEVRAWQHEHLRHPLPMKLDAVLRAQLPPGARVVTVRFPPVISDVILTADCPGAEPFGMPLRPGEASPAIAVGGSRAQAVPADGATGAPVEPPPMSTLDAFARYVRLGFTHIVPEGLDHILFVLGLFLLSVKPRALLLQVTAFTVAHSITLALSMLGVVELSPRIVEPLIAASIAFVAIENVATDRLHAWRPLVVSAFGLVHGMGFAGVLRELGLPRGQMVTALVGFNVGVELGQLAVIVLAFAALGWWQKRAWYRRRIVIPLSLFIAAVGLVWTVQRAF